MLKFLLVEVRLLTRSWSSSVAHDKVQPAAFTPAEMYCSKNINTPGFVSTKSYIRWKHQVCTQWFQDWGMWHDSNDAVQHCFYNRAFTTEYTVPAWHTSLIWICNLIWDQSVHFLFPNRRSPKILWMQTCNQSVPWNVWHSTERNAQQVFFCSQQTIKHKLTNHNSYRLIASSNTDKSPFVLENHL